MLIFYKYLESSSLWNSINANKVSSTGKGYREKYYSIIFKLKYLIILDSYTLLFSKTRPYYFKEHPIISKYTLLFFGPYYF